MGIAVMHHLAWSSGSYSHVTIVGVFTGRPLTPRHQYKVMLCYGYSPEAIAEAVGETEKFASTYHTRRIFDAMSDLVFGTMLMRIPWAAQCTWHNARIYMLYLK